MPSTLNRPPSSSIEWFCQWHFAPPIVPSPLFWFLKPVRVFYPFLSLPSSPSSPLIIQPPPLRRRRREKEREGWRKGGNFGFCSSVGCISPIKAEAREMDCSSLLSIFAPEVKNGGNWQLSTSTRLLIVATFGAEFCPANQNCFLPSLALFIWLCLGVRTFD